MTEIATVATSSVKLFLQNDCFANFPKINSTKLCHLATYIAITSVTSYSFIDDSIISTLCSTLQEIEAIQDVDNGVNTPKGLTVLPVLLLGTITILLF